MSQHEFAGVSLGGRYWKVGDRAHVWIVDALVPAADMRTAQVVLVSEDGGSVEEIELSHLKDLEQYAPVS